MRQSLAIIRSLGRKKLKVTGVEQTRFATGLFSKHCQRALVLSGSRKHPEEFVERLLETVRDNSYQVVFPVTDATVWAVARRNKEPSRYTIVPQPDSEVLARAMDKGDTLKVAERIGIPCPKTYLIDSEGDLETLKDETNFPVIIEPRTSSGSRGVRLCSSPRELLLDYPSVVATFGPSLVQEYITPGGEEIGVYALLNFNSELRAVTVQHRPRSYPPSGGPSTLRETVQRPELITVALRLLQALGWWGIATVEFKTDPRDNQPKLMEINHRRWCSLQLSILAKADSPYLLYELVTEGDVEPVEGYQTGVRCRWLLPGDLLRFLSAPGKLSNLPRFLRFEGNDDIISCRDIGPTLGFFMSTLRHCFDREMWQFVLRERNR